MHPVYKCEDYTLHTNSILVVTTPIIVGYIKDADSFADFLSLVKYDAIICPSLFKNKDGQSPKIVLFK